MIRKYRQADLLNMSPAQLRHAVLDVQTDREILRRKYMSLRASIQGYLLGITQLKKHIQRIQARTKNLIEDEEEEGLVL